MIKETTCKELIRHLIDQKQFGKAEIIINRIQNKNERLFSIELIFNAYLKAVNYEDAFSLIGKFLKEDELLYYKLILIKHQQEKTKNTSNQIINQIKNILSEVGSNVFSIKTNSLLSEICFLNNELELADQYNEKAYQTWANTSGNPLELTPLIISLKNQNQVVKIKNIFSGLNKSISENTSDEIERANFFFELNQLNSLLEDENYSNDESNWTIEDILFTNGQPYNLDDVKSTCLKFISKPKNSKISVLLNRNKSIYSIQLLQCFNNYLNLDNQELINKLNILRGHLNSENKIIQLSIGIEDEISIEQLSDYCTLSQVFFIKKDFKISENILSHALSIAMNQVDSHHPSTLNFSAGPKYECLYLVCFHHLIQGKIDSANIILEDMENTYQSLDNQFNLFSLCDDALSWFSSTETFKTEILKYLYDKLFDKFNSSLSLINVKYAVLILQANDYYSQKDYVIQKLNELVNKLSHMALKKELKEACMIEVIKGLLKFDCLDTVIEILQTSDFSEKSTEEIYERLANYYFTKEPDLTKLISTMKGHGKWLPDMNLKTIFDESNLASLAAEMVTPVICLFADNPENIEVILSKYSLNN